MMTAKVLHANLEGVVLKSPSSTYQPGKRNWLKVKKDYLFDGKMADTADLVVLGAWYGSGKKGGILSIFLMGCYDSKDHLWKTVTKVHSGLDDITNDEVHNSLIKLTERADANQTPSWLLCKKALVPDVLAKNPLDMPVWEITGAEFTKAEAHTASGISIRFPRITRRRSDKTAKEANDLAHLEDLFDASKKNVNVDLLLAGCDPQKKELGSEKTPQKVSKPSSSQTSSTKKAKTSTPGSDDGEKSPIPRKRKVERGLSPSQKGLKDFFKPSKEKLEVKKESKSPKSKLFLGLVAHFAMEKDLAKLREQFEMHGGSSTTDTRKANLVFYNTTEVVDINKLR